MPSMKRSIGQSGISLIYVIFVVLADIRKCAVTFFFSPEFHMISVAYVLLHLFEGLELNDTDRTKATFHQYASHICSISNI